MDKLYYLDTAYFEREHWWYVARRRILAHVLDQLDLPASSEILEAGCGTGGNLSLLSHYGRLSAFEPEAIARHMANGRGIVDVAEGALPGPIPFPAEHFDLVAILDVVEHVKEDVAALRALREVLKPGGVLLITVPAYNFLWSNHDVINHHQRRYTAGSLKKAVKEAGLSVTYTTYFNTILFPPVLAVRMYHKAVGKREGSDFAMPGPAVNRFLTGLFASERWAMKGLSLPFGSSILMLARRLKGNGD
ncbi:MAG TPA: class I SAM-dependent methyltransferase [Rhodothermales bacterium]|nr:class I SAM-dependent methyltransferase [Rhodothermales bacterium]